MLRRAADETPDRPALIVHQGTPEEGARFLASRWPGARAVSDPERRLFRAIGLERASAGQVLGLGVWREALNNVRHGIGKPMGDPMLLAGSYVLDGGEVVAAAPAENVATAPDLEELYDIAAARESGLV